MDAFRCGFGSWQRSGMISQLGTADKEIVVPYGIPTVFNTASFSFNQDFVRRYPSLSRWRSSWRPQQCLNDNITSTINITTQQDCDGRGQAPDSAGGVCYCCYSNIPGMRDQRKSLLAAIGWFILTKRPVCLLRMGTGIC